MAFTGKATYSSGMTLPEGAEDVADIVAILSPHETPLLDALGDPLREAANTHHQWLEDEPGDRKQRVRRGNYAQIFAGTVQAGSAGIRPYQGLADEIDYQKQERIRVLLRDLEDTVINGIDLAPAGSPHTKMLGIRHFLQTNVVNAGGKELDEGQVNAMLRRIWEDSSGIVDLIVVGPFQKRKMNEFCARGGNPDKPLDPIVTTYESDFGICKIITTRWLPQDAALFLDSSRISVLPLAGRNFYFKPLASVGDYESGEVIGEYTLELRDEAAHGLITGLSMEETK
jgi:hypothetical protein